MLNIDFNGIAAVKGMKMRRVMVRKVDLNDDAVKRLTSGMGYRVS